MSDESDEEDDGGDVIGSGGELGNSVSGDNDGEGVRVCVCCLCRGGPRAEATLRPGSEATVLSVVMCHPNKAATRLFLTVIRRRR